MDPSLKTPATTARVSQTWLTRDVEVRRSKYLSVGADKKPGVVHSTTLCHFLKVGEEYLFAKSTSVACRFLMVPLAAEF